MTVDPNVRLPDTRRGNLVERRAYADPQCEVTREIQTPRAMVVSPKVSARGFLLSALYNFAMHNIKPGRDHHRGSHYRIA